jgi:hypothetical protein
MQLPHNTVVARDHQIGISRRNRLMEGPKGTDAAVGMDFADSTYKGEWMIGRTNCVDIAPVTQEGER